jgi:hypothetical protein
MANTFSRPAWNFPSFMSGNGANLEFTLTDTFGVNCSSHTVIKNVTVAVKFWHGGVPNDWEANNKSLNCGYAKSTPCSGPILVTNFPIEMMPAFTDSFKTGGNVPVFAFPMRGFVETIVFSMDSLTEVYKKQTIASIIKAGNGYGGISSIACAACGSSTL